MKVRLIIAARATTGAVLLAVTVAACTGGSPSSSVPSIFTASPATPSSALTGGPSRTPTVGHTSATAGASAGASASGRASSSAKASATASATASAKPKPSATRSPSAHATRTAHRPAATPAPTPVPTASQYPDGAPATGGGGTAGLQDGLLFGVGAAAILAGLGSLGYRRRLRRKHRAGIPARSDTPARTGVR